MGKKIPSGIFSTGLIDNIFNTHRDLVGNAILNRISDIINSNGGILIDSISDTGLQVIATSPYDGTIRIKAGTAYDKFGQRVAISSDDTGVAILTGTVDLSSGVDLSINKYIKLNIDNTGAVQIDCSTSAANTSSVTIDEILANINSAGFGTIAFRSDSSGNPTTTGKYITIKSSTSGSSSEVELIAPSTNDATQEILGLNEASYPHTYSGGGGYAIPADSTTYNIIIEYLSVENTVGNFLSGYPTGNDTKYTKREDSYKVTVTASAPVDSASEHELLLATVSNNGSALTITDKRGDNILRLKGVKQVDDTPPAAPTKVSLTTTQKTSEFGYIIPKWNPITDASGIRAYIVRLTLTEEDGVAVSNSQPEEIMIQGFDTTVNQLYTRIMKPLGDKYKVEVAAMDGSLSSNISPYTDFGQIVTGAVASTITMPQITLTPINGGVYVDWADIVTPMSGSSAVVGGRTLDTMKYQYVYTLDGALPQWGGAIYDTYNSEFTILTAPGTTVKVRVRAVKNDMTVTNDVSGEAVAGGVLIGDNEKLLSLDGLSVANTDDGKSARYLGRRVLVNPSNISKLYVNVNSLTLNTAEKGMVRVYRENAEAEAVYITFKTTGSTEIPVDADMTAGWLIIDAYDSAESGTNQASFNADVHIAYIEGSLMTPIQKGKSSENTGIK